MYLLNDAYSVNPAPRHIRSKSADLFISGQKNKPIISINNIEYQLSNFISWVLEVTANGEYSGTAAMELLDQAWMAQKLVWKLRESQSI